MADIVIQSSTQPEIVVEHDDRTVIIQEPDRPKEVVIGAPVAVEGTPTSGANVGGGDAEVFRDKVGFALNFRTISGIGGITVAAYSAWIILLAGRLANGAPAPAIGTG